MARFIAVDFTVGSSGINWLYSGFTDPMSKRRTAHSRVEMCRFADGRCSRFLHLFVRSTLRS